MSEDLIRRSDAIKVAKEFWYKPDIAGALAELPAIEPKVKVIAQVIFDEEKLREIVKGAVERFKEEYEIEPKRGEWVKRTHNTLIAQVNFAYCSECGQPIMHEHTRPLWSFCPNCGADMRGKDDEASD